MSKEIGLLPGACGLQDLAVEAANNPEGLPIGTIRECGRCSLLPMINECGAVCLADADGNPTYRQCPGQQELFSQGGGAVVSNVIPHGPSYSPFR